MTRQPTCGNGEADADARQRVQVALNAGSSSAEHIPIGAGFPNCRAGQNDMNIADLQVCFLQSCSRARLEQCKITWLAIHDDVERPVANLRSHHGDYVSVGCHQVAGVIEGRQDAGSERLLSQRAMYGAADRASGKVSQIRYASSAASLAAHAIHPAQHQQHCARCCENRESDLGHIYHRFDPYSLRPDDDRGHRSA